MSIFRPEWPLPRNVHSFISLRAGGYSEAPFTSLNLASHVGDLPEAVVKNRAKLGVLCKRTFGHTPHFHWLNQVHGCQIADISCKTELTDISDADAAYTNAVGEACAVLTADCLPLLVSNSAGTEVAAIHAGWRGLAAGVISNTVEKFRANPEELIVFLGPAISQSAFQVGAEVRQCFLDASRFGLEPMIEQAFLKDGESHDKYFADLYALARLELQALGVRRTFGGSRCTYSENHSFFSYRKEGATGRFASAIWIAPEN